MVTINLTYRYNKSLLHFILGTNALKIQASVEFAAYMILFLFIPNWKLEALHDSNQPWKFYGDIAVYRLLLDLIFFLSFDAIFFLQESYLWILESFNAMIIDLIQQNAWNLLNFFLFFSRKAIGELFHMNSCLLFVMILVLKLSILVCELFQLAIFISFLPA